MTDFKVGDKVRVTHKQTIYYGLEGFVSQVTQKKYGFRVDFPNNDSKDIPFLTNELELITPQKEETVAFNNSNRRKYTGDTVIVERNHEDHERPEGFAYIRSAKHFGERFTFDVREVPEVTAALQSVYDDYQQMLEAATPKVEDVLNGLGIGAVIRTLQGNHWVKTRKDSWSSNGSATTLAGRGVALVYSETLSEGVHLD